MSAFDQLRNSALFKLTVIGFLTLGLLIPLLFVYGMVQERESRRSEAVNEIAGKWGGPQTIVGPILILPYRHAEKDAEGKTLTTIRTAYFLPERLEVRSNVTAEKRARSIYETVLYSTEASFAARFERPDLRPLRIDPGQVLWSDARIAIAVPDTRGIQETDLGALWNGRRVAFEPGTGADGPIGNGVHAAVGDLRGAGEYEFSAKLRLQGSAELMFAPAAKETVVVIESDWSDPSFQGAFLPSERTVSAEGFQAVWKTSYFGSGAPARWTSENPYTINTLRENASGVRLLLPVDIYQKIERAVKYGVMFIALTFLAFFLMEVFQKIGLHPINYLLVGAALIVFYLLFLSLSEHLGFGIAYGAAALATIGLIVFYSRSVLGTRKGALSVAGMLVGLYGYLFVVLQSQDYALLLGSLILFAVLAAVMALTRKLDWSQLSLARRE